MLLVKGVVRAGQEWGVMRTGKGCPGIKIYQKSQKY